MLKTLLAATTAITLMSAVSFAETTTETKSLNLGPIGMSTTTHQSENDRVGVTSETNTVHREVNRDLDQGAIEKDKTVTKSTDITPSGDVVHRKDETTTIR